MVLPQRLLVPLAGLALAACGGGGGTGGRSEPPQFPVAFASAVFSGHAIDNPWFPLTPGTTTVHAGPTPEGFEETTSVVQAARRTVAGVACVEVRVTARLDGVLIEDTLDWYAQDDAGNVWYFGEATQEIEGGRVVSTQGSWEAGVGGALAGIQMLAVPVVGTTYSQEHAAGVAEDRATVVATGETVLIARGPQTGCVHTLDFTPLDPSAREDKHYAPGLGLVLEVGAGGARLELVSVTP